MNLIISFSLFEKELGKPHIGISLSGYPKKRFLPMTVNKIDFPSPPPSIHTSLHICIAIATSLVDLTAISIKIWQRKYRNIIHWSCKIINKCIRDYEPMPIIREYTEQWHRQVCWTEGVELSSHPDSSGAMVSPPKVKMEMLADGKHKCVRRNRKKKSEE